MKRNDWVYMQGGIEVPSFSASGAPSEKVIAQGEVSLRFSTYLEIEEDDVLKFPDLPVCPYLQEGKGSRTGFFHINAWSRTGWY